MDPVMLRGLVEVQPKNSSDPSASGDLIALQQPSRAYHSSRHLNPPERLSAEYGVSFAPGLSPSASRSKGDDLEMSPPLSPAEPPSPGDVAEVQPSVWEPYMNRYRLVGLCTASLGNALFDGAAGALIPYMEKHYNIGFAIVSLIFVGQAIGFITSAFFLDSLRALLGRAKLLALGQTLLIIACTPLIALAPFPVIVASFLLVGFGIAINVAMGNIFCGGLQNGTLMLGFLHGFYGVGGTTGPLIATAMVTVGGVAWGRYYAVILGVFVVTLGLAVWSFWRFEDEQTPEARAKEMPADQRTALKGMFSALKLKVVTLGALFIFAYQGAEVSISGWVISFLIHARGGDPSSVGYVTSGFWAGITLGRFVLSHPAQKVGEKRFVYAVTIAAIGLQLLVWWVPNIVGNAVAVSIVGLALGPIYPCSVSVIMRNLPSRDTLSGMGTISAFGSMGGAVAPFLTGLLAQAVGTWVLHPIVIGLFVVMLICWCCIPKEDKKEE